MLACLDLVESLFRGKLSPFRRVCQLAVEGMYSVLVEFPGDRL